MKTIKESDFAHQLGDTASLLDCRYISIPDLIPHKGKIPVAHKRPFDGILITPSANLAIELKIDYRPLKPHQREYLEYISQVNSLAFVIRHITTKKGVIYRVDLPVVNRKYPIIFSSSSIVELIKFLKSQGVRKHE